MKKEEDLRKRNDKHIFLTLARDLKAPYIIYVHSLHRM